MEVPDDVFKRMQSIDLSESSDFKELTRIAGLSPENDFVDVDLSGLPLAGADLSNYNFSGTDLRGTNIRLCRDFKNLRISNETQLDEIDARWKDQNVVNGKIKIVPKIKEENIPKPSMEAFTKQSVQSGLPTAETLWRREVVRQCRKNVQDALHFQVNTERSFERIVKSYMQLGLALSFTFEFEEAISFIKLSLIALDDLHSITLRQYPNLQGTLFHLLALFSKQLGLFEQGANYARRSLAIQGQYYLVQSIPEMRRDTLNECLSIQR